MKDKVVVIQNIVIIIVLLVVTFLSQQPYFRFVGKNVYAEGNTYFAQSQSWVKTNILPKIGGGAASIKDSATKEITVQKDNVVQNLWENFKNYFAEKFSKTFGTKVK